MRCFVAIELGDAARRAVEKLLAQLHARRGVRWCTPEQLHVTLKFLGEVPDARLPAVVQALRGAAAGCAPFALELRGLGCFPSPARPRVFWAGINDPAGGCAGWVRAADPLLAAAVGTAPESRPYTPHVTLGRVRDDAGPETRAALEGVAAPAGCPWNVREVVLFESVLSPRGARYTAAARVELGGSARLE
jgi:2'-5' RNA ligase